MLTHEQLACIQNFVETQTLHYIRRLFADIEYYLITQQRQMDSNTHSFGCRDDQMQFIRTVFGQSSMNEQSNDRNFSIVRGDEQPHDREFSMIENNEQSLERNYPTSKNNEQSLERNYPTSKNNEQSPERNYSTSKNNEQSPERNYTTSKNNEQSHDRNFTILSDNEQSFSLDFAQGAEQMKVYPENIPSVQKQDMLNAAIASLPTQYSNGHRVPRYYLERLKLTLRVIYSRPGIVRKELAVVLQVSERTVSNLCNFLLKHHHIVIKNHRDGRWYPPLP